MKPRIHTRSRAGFTLLEIAIAAAILVMLSGMLITALDNLRSITLTGSVESKLQEAGERALEQILQDLHRSGVDATRPQFITDGNPSVGGFGAHAHAPPAQHGVAGDVDFGPSTDVVFLLPADADAKGTPGYGVPDIDGAGQLVWDAREFSYVLITAANGVNTLQRRTNGVNPRAIATHVERVVFTDVSATGMRNVIRVQIFMRQADSGGAVHRYRAEARVQLRNG